MKKLLLILALCLLTFSGCEKDQSSYCLDSFLIGGTWTNMEDGSLLTFQGEDRLFLYDTINGYQTADWYVVDRNYLVIRPTLNGVEICETLRNRIEYSYGFKEFLFVVFDSTKVKYIRNFKNQ